MSIQQLRYVVAAIRSNSSVQAANSLIVSPQAISKAISITERQLGKDLFDRSNGIRTPTEFAVRFADKAAAVIEEYDDLEAMSRLPSLSSKTSGALSVATAATPFRGEIFSDEKLSAFRSKNPTISIKLMHFSNEDCLQAVSLDIADAAIVSGRTRNDGLKCVRIDRQDITVLAHDTNSLTAKNRLNFEDLSASRIAYPATLTILYPLIKAKFLEAGLRLPSFEHIEASEQAALSFLHDGGIILSGKNNPLLVEDEHLHEIKLENRCAISLPICFAYKENNENAALQSLLSYLYDRAPRMK